MNKIFRRIVRKSLIILPISQAWLDWMIMRVLEFYEAAQVEKKLDVFDRNQETKMNFTHYLPDTEKRIERLAKLINKRPVAIVLPGYSVKELEQRITELKDCDICYSGVNHFWIIEKYILQKINCNLSIITSGADPRARMNNIISFLERQEDNIVFSTSQAFQQFGLDKFIEKYDEKLLFLFGISTPFMLTLGGGLFPQIPSKEYPLHFVAQNSLSILLSLAIIGGASKVIIFGGDGGRINNQGLYFREIDSENRNFNSESKIMIDTEVFNATMPLMLKKVYKTYNLEPVDIINCSEKSYYTPFRKLSYDKTFDLLKL